MTFFFYHRTWQSPLPEKKQSTEIHRKTCLKITLTELVVTWCVLNNGFYMLLPMENWHHHKRNRSLVGLLDLQHLRSLKISTSESRAIQCCQIHVLLFQMAMKSPIKIGPIQDRRWETHFLCPKNLSCLTGVIDRPPFFFSQSPSSEKSLKAERLMIVTVFGADKLQQEYSIGHVLTR